MTRFCFMSSPRWHLARIDTVVARSWNEIVKLDEMDEIVTYKKNRENVLGVNGEYIISPTSGRVFLIN